MPLMPLFAHKQQSGFTLIELIITMIIMSFAAIIAMPFIAAVTQHPNPVLREKAVALGQAMMDEILSKRWDENTPNGGSAIVTATETTAGARGTDLTTPLATAPASLGPEGAETRATFDDVDDYATIAEPDGLGRFSDQNGAFLPGIWTGFQRVVNVTYIASSQGNIDAATTTSLVTTDTKRIVVTITSPLGETFQLVAVSCNF